MADEGRWPVVGQAIRRRMQELAWLQADLIRESGLSDMTIRPFQDGEPNNSRPATRAKVAKALGWAPDAIDLILDGTDPADLAIQNGRSPADEVVDLTGLTEDDKAQIRAIVERFKRR